MDGLRCAGGRADRVVRQHTFAEEDVIPFVELAWDGDRHDEDEPFDENSQVGRDIVPDQLVVTMMVRGSSASEA